MAIPNKTAQSIKCKVLLENIETGVSFFIEKKKNQGIERKKSSTLNLRRKCFQQIPGVQCKS